MSTVKYNSQSDNISVAESSGEDHIIVRDFKCVSANRLWSLLSGQKFKGMIFDRFSYIRIFINSREIIVKGVCLFILGIVTGTVAMLLVSNGQTRHNKNDNAVGQRNHTHVTVTVGRVYRSCHR